MKKITSLLILFALLGVGYFVYQSVFATSNTPQIHYITEAVKRGNLDKSVLATGSVRASQRTEVGVQVSGKIQTLYVKLGQAVQKGQAIADIDSETQQNDLNTAQAELSSYKTQLHSRAEKNDLLLVPTIAIKKKGRENYVLVLENGKSVEKAVEIGLNDSSHTEILSGLMVGEEIITAQRSQNERIGSNNLREILRIGFQ